MRRNLRPAIAMRKRRTTAKSCATTHATSVDPRHGRLWQPGVERFALGSTVGSLGCR
jgi:hypothetical protein